MPKEEERLWQMDVRMNAFGVRVDEELTDGALYIDERSRQDPTGEAMGITGIDNPNSTVQLMEWLEKNGTETDNLRKATVTDLLAEQPADNVKRMRRDPPAAGEDLREEV